MAKQTSLPCGGIRGGVVAGGLLKLALVRNVEPRTIVPVAIGQMPCEGEPVAPR